MERQGNHDEHGSTNGKNWIQRPPESFPRNWKRSYCGWPLEFIFAFAPNGFVLLRGPDWQRDYRWARLSSPKLS